MLVDKEHYVYRNLVSFIENGYGATTSCAKPDKYLFKITQSFVNDIIDLVDNEKSSLSYNKKLGEKYGVSEKFIRQYRDAYLLYTNRAVNKPKEKGRLQIIQELEELKREYNILKKEYESLKRTEERLIRDCETYSTMYTLVSGQVKQLKLELLKNK